MARKLRKLAPDTALFRRRATGEPLREIASDYGVSHTSLSRYFRGAEAVRQLKRAEQLLRAEQRAEEARFRDELRAQEARWRAERQAEREARRRVQAEERAGSVSAAEPVTGPDASERGSRPGRAEAGAGRWRGRAKGGRIARVRAGETYTLADWLDERDARRPAPPDPPVRLVTESGKTVGRTSASNAERMAAALEPHHGPLTVVPA